MLGSQAQVTIDGRTYFSDTNKVSTAIGGVTLTLLAEGTSTVTVTPDQVGLTSAVKDLVSAYNTLADKLDTLTANAAGPDARSPCRRPDLRMLALSLRRTLLDRKRRYWGVHVAVADRPDHRRRRCRQGHDESPPAGRGQAQGGARPGPDGGRRASSTRPAGAIKPFQDAVNTWTKSGGRIDKALESITSSLKLLDTREDAAAGTPRRPPGARSRRSSRH